MSDPIELQVTIPEQGLRLDKWLSARLQEVSRSRLQQLIEQGHLHCNGKVVTNGSAKVKAGAMYILTVPEIVPLALEPVKMPLDIIYEDEHLLVINKQAGLTVHPSTTSYDATLVHGLLAHCGDSLSGIGGVARPGIVHRIDKDTTGLLVVAKHDQSHAHLSAQLKSRTLKRTYIAYCVGMPQPAQGTIEGNIARSPNNRKKMAVVPVGGKVAITHYRTDTIYRNDLQAIAAKIICQLDTGRTHQIRVHMAHIGHALIGDQIYGRKGFSLSKFYTSKDYDATNVIIFERQALHAHQLSLLHPISGEEMTFVAPLPQDLIDLENALKNIH